MPGLPPAVHWNLSIVSKLLDSVLVDLEVIATHYLQPVRESVYSVTSYSKPFILSLDRKTYLI